MIEAARTTEGRAEADEFIADLERNLKRRGNLQRLADIAIRMEEFAERGTLRVPLQLNHLRDDIYEIKAGDVRLPFFYGTHFVGKTVRLTHGFLKKSQKTPRKHIAKALWVMKEDGLPL
ncbi:type II toxin-antitoxin system RelE/ParE family toxin [Streptomyces mirabilis]|uniref:type II toxin-antitoxin system RelE/ParE family toxin n=1 Tax=Streptomyces mirabilis TaxID=68239 RepID=UPI00225397F7|nr:type II toxin-antitoxin system RelE/ParE family toxin [Streptomyces mirabilis]MCX5352005.1 type II toxin-antitoxin system RelE/ParE family toxin [Streptomyces mirabilis]